MRVLDKGFVTLEAKTCTKCERELPMEQFDFRADRETYQSYCVECRRIAQRERYERYKLNSFFTYKATRAKARATSLGIPFDLDASYLESIWSGTCPISGVELVIDDRTSEAGAELDRFEPAIGYVRGNVAFISRRMNRAKNNLTVDEVHQLLDWMVTP